MNDTPEKIAAEIQDIGFGASSMIGAKVPRAFPRGEFRTVEPKWADVTAGRCIDLAARVRALPAWRPIDEAPTNGRDLLCVLRKSGRAALAACDPQGEFDDDHDGFGWVEMTVFECDGSLDPVGRMDDDPPAWWIELPKQASNR